MASWSPREAAEYRNVTDAQKLREVATDKVVRCGLRRLVGIARASGYHEFVYAGFKFGGSETSQGPQRRLAEGEHRSGSEDAANRGSETSQGSLRVSIDQAARTLPKNKGRGRAPTPPQSPQPWRRLPGRMHAALRDKPGWFTSGLWKAHSQQRFGIKKQTQKVQSSVRVAVGLIRWRRRVRARASALASS